MGAWGGDWGSRLPERQQGEAVLGTGQGGILLAGPGMEVHLVHRGRGQRGILAGDHHRKGSHRQGEGAGSHPEGRTAGHGSHCTPEGSLTWTFCLGQEGGGELRGGIMRYTQRVPYLK